jgi:hypothetical protein
MTEQNPPAEPQPDPDEHWVVPEQPAEPSEAAPPAPAAPPPAAPSRRNWRRPLVGAGLVAAGVVLGAGAAVLISHSTSDSTGHGIAAGAPPGARGGYPGAPGVADEQHVQGTLSAVGTTSITVSTASGKTTYPVSSSTQIIRNGAPATLDQLKVGDPVVVHVIPSSNGRQVERIIAGTMPMPDGPGGFDDNNRDGGHR